MPNINYHYWLDQWHRNVGVIRPYVNVNMEPYIAGYGNFATIDDCERVIDEITRLNHPTKEQILMVVDLINMWGGKTSRMFNARNPSPRQILDGNLAPYQNAIALARIGNPISVDAFAMVHGIGDSYASKHATFWSKHAERPLIIIDNKMAGAMGYPNVNALYNEFTYAEVIEQFVNTAQAVFQNNRAGDVEKALFAFHNYYFLNNNQGWKNQRVNGVDYAEALRIANQLNFNG